MGRVYNNRRIKTKRKHKRGIPLQEGDYHLVVHVWIINNKGEFLIQQRQPWKKGYPNWWDCSAAGSALAGDDSKLAAIRETKEELGVDLDMTNAMLLLCHKFSCGFDDVWIVQQNVEINDLNLQYEEVKDAKWVSKATIMDMIEQKQFIPYPYMEYIYDMVKHIKQLNLK